MSKITNDLLQCNTMLMTD